MGRIVDLTGQKFNKLTVIKKIDNFISLNKKTNKFHSQTQYLCRCDCGIEVIKKYAEVYNKKRPICGNKACHFHMTSLIGRRFYKLEVISFSHRGKGTKLFWNCLCDCGQNKITSGSCLIQGDCKSCGCSTNELISKSQKGKIATNRKSFGESNFNSIFSRYRYSAKNRNLIWELTKDEFKFITSQNCYLCGIPPKTKTHTSAKKPQIGYYIYNGIDRVDNSIGYIFENCKPCCSDCNYAKQDSKLEEFFDHIKRIYIYNKF